jgi:chromosome partitioning protein
MKKQIPNKSLPKKQSKQPMQPTERHGATAKKETPVLAKEVKTTRIIAICNQKGGCGKTTTVINVAAGLAAVGLRVLVVDLDSQGNATSGLGINDTDVEASTFHLLAEPKKYNLESVVLESPYPNLHVAPASIELSELESRISREVGRENRLKKALQMVSGFYDYILIDTPPSLGLLSVNALNAAHEVHIAMQAHPFAFDGLIEQRYPEK